MCADKEISQETINELIKSSEDYIIECNKQKDEALNAIETYKDNRDNKDMVSVYLILIDKINDSIKQAEFAIKVLSLKK